MLKVFVDTNTLLRLLLKDNPDQYHQALKLFSRAANQEVQLVTSTLTFFEVKWVLASLYQLNKSNLIVKLNLLLSFQGLEIDDHEIISEALDLFADQNLALEDCYYLVKARSLGCDKLQTFDQKLDKLSRKYLA